MNWVKAHADQLPENPMPENVDMVEMDELYTFIMIVPFIRGVWISFLHVSSLSN